LILTTDFGYFFPFTIGFSILSESLANVSSDYNLATLLHHVDQDVSRGLPPYRAMHLSETVDNVLDRASKIELGEKVIPPPRLMSPIPFSESRQHRTSKPIGKSRTKGSPKMIIKSSPMTALLDGALESRV
jgi:hypothetical protein